MAANERITDDVDELRAQLQAQATEIERLQGMVGDTPDRVSRRGLIKGLGLGGLVALGTAGAGLTGTATTAQAAPGGAVESSDLAGELPALLRLTLNGKDVAGDVTGTPDRTGAIEVLYYQSDVKSPRDLATGQASGRRQYQPVIIRKRIDKASPLLARALATNQIGDATIQFYRQAAGHGVGGQEQFFTVQFQGISFASIQHLLPDTHKSAGEVSTPPIEELTFTFQKITWTFVDGGITATDDWSTST